MTRHRGLERLPDSAIPTGEQTAVWPISGGARPNEVLWWHWCQAEHGWIASGLAAHTLTGHADLGDLTIRASLLCVDCGKHGWITDNRWSDA